MRIRPPRFLVAALLGATAGACASQAREVAPAAEATQPPRAPLASFRVQPLVVTPVQRLRDGDAMGWLATAGEADAQLAALDEELATAARGRGAAGWAMAAEVERSARRNPTMAPDPHALAIDELLPSRLPAQLAGPLGSQLRALVALGGQRHVLVPIELRYVRRADGLGEAVLRLVLVDTRLARPLWSTEVRSAPADAWSRALLVGVAGQFADLIMPPGDDRGPGA
jgi:hypothetical protein